MIFVLITVFPKQLELYITIKSLVLYWIGNLKKKAKLAAKE